MKWLLYFMGAAMALSAGAQTKTEEQALAIAAQVRRDGCKGHPGTQVPLRWSPALARAAASIAKGGAALQSVEAQGYRPTRVFHSNLVGYGNAADAARGFAQHYCADVVEPKFLDFGMHRDGKQ